MNEEEIRLLLDHACNNPALFFQISQQPPYLYLFINRQTDASLDYEALTSLLAETIADLELPHIDYLALYSRPWGQVDTDWQNCVALEEFVRETMLVSSAEVEAEKARIMQERLAMAAHSLEDVTEVVSSLANQPIEGEDFPATWLESSHPMTITTGQATAIPGEQLRRDPTQKGAIQPDLDLNSEDFSSYCFIRDRILLEANLREIPPKVAKTVVVFHRFPTRGKHRVLPLLGQVFEGDRGIVFIHFPDQVQQWFEVILTLNVEELESARLWFSRYCVDTTKTIKEIQFLMRIVSEQETFVPDRSSPAQSSPKRSTPAQSTSIAADTATSNPAKAPRLSFDARPRNVLPPDSASTVPATPVSPEKPRLSVSAPSQSTDPIESSSPRHLWIWFVLLGIGALFLGSIAGAYYGRGGTFWMWLTLLLALSLEAFSAATANMALRRLEGGLFTACWIIYLILPFGRGIIGGYLAGWLLGLGMGNILRQELASSRKPLPQDLSGLAGLFQTKSGTIALATALIGFTVPLLLSTGGNTVSNALCDQEAILNSPDGNAYTYCSIATELVEDTSQLETAMKTGVVSPNPEQLSDFCQKSALTTFGITTLDPKSSTVEAQVIPIQGGLYASEILVNSPTQRFQATCILANTATQVQLLGQEIFSAE